MSAQTYRTMGVILALVIAATFPLPAHAASVASLQTIYRQALTKIDRDHDTELATTLDRYGQSLDRVIRTLQSKGDLEGLLAVKEEKKRFDKAHDIPDKTLARAGAIVTKLQADLRRAKLSLTLKKHKDVLSLTDKYVSRLETLKKTYTIKGDIDKALAAKQEIARVKKSAAVSAAQFSIAEHEVASTPDSTSLPGTGNMIACPHCNGTGLADKPCPYCNGSGKCATCGGTGQRNSGFRGSTMKVGCISCKMTGTCPHCKGTGKAGQPCPHCKGTGKVPADTPARVTPAPPRKPARPTRRFTPPAPKRKPIDTSGIETFSQTLRTMHKNYLAGKNESADFEKVVRNPKDYLGRVLTSSVYLVKSHPRRVYAAGTLHDAKLGGHELVPFDVDVGTRVEKLFWSIMRNHKTTITYGVVNEKHISLFDARKD